MAQILLKMAGGSYLTSPLLLTIIFTSVLVSRESVAEFINNISLKILIKSL